MKIPVLPPKGEGGKSGWGPSELGRRNRALVIASLRESGALSRVELAHLTSLSKAAITNIVTQLVDEGVLREEANGQRARLSINGKHACAVGVEMTTDGQIRGLAVDAAGESLVSARARYDPESSPDELTEQVVGLVGDLFVHLQSNRERVKGIGLVLPGLIDSHRGTPMWWPGLRQWEGAPLRDTLSKRLSLPVIVDWRGYAATLAELRYGSGRGGRDFLYVHVGSGVGMGIVIGGRIIRGHGSMAGQLGHIRVTDRGTMCACGSRGCLQTLVTVPAIIHRVEQAVADGVLSLLTRPSTATASPLIFEQIIEGARHGDKLALNILEETGEYLGIALASLINIFNPGLVIVGGEIEVAGEILLDFTRRATRRHAIPQFYEIVRIELTHLQEANAAALGGATLVLDRLFSLDSISVDHSAGALPRS